MNTVEQQKTFATSRLRFYNIILTHFIRVHLIALEV